MPDTLSPQELHNMDAYWRAANYLSVGQIYLRANPLLQEPLTQDHIKPRRLDTGEQRRDSTSFMCISTV